MERSLDASVSGNPGLSRYPAILLSITPSASPLLGHPHHFIIPRINPSNPQYPPSQHLLPPLPPFLAADELGVTSKSANQRQHLSRKHYTFFCCPYSIDKLWGKLTTSKFFFHRFNVIIKCGKIIPFYHNCLLFKFSSFFLIIVMRIVSVIMI